MLHGHRIPRAYEIAVMVVPLSRGSRTERMSPRFIRQKEHPMSAARSVVFALLVPVTACASQVDGDNQGTPLATFHGNVSSQRTATPTAADVAVIWRDWMGPGLIAGGIEPVQGNFPAEFELAMYVPPPANVINHDTGEDVGFAVAYIEAVEPGQTEFLWPAPQSLGADFEHLLVYVPADVPAGSFPALLLHDTPSAGFHLYGVRQLAQDEKNARWTCMAGLPVPWTWRDAVLQCGGAGGYTINVDFVPLPADLATPLSVKLVDEDALLRDFPTWW